MTMPKKIKEITVIAVTGQFFAMISRTVEIVKVVVIRLAPSVLVFCRINKLPPSSCTAPKAINIVGVNP